MTNKEYIIKMAKELCTSEDLCENCSLYKYNECAPIDYSKKFYDAGYRKTSEKNKILRKEEENNICSENLTNSLEKLCVDFVADTLLNAPKDIENKVIKYGEHDKKVLNKVIKEQMEMIEYYRFDLTSSCYRGLPQIKNIWY